MFEKITPEEAGVSSAEVLRFLRSLQNRKLRMHSVLLMKGEKVFGEFGFAPFSCHTPHRMYSQTKSFVSVAIGLLEQEGKLNLDRPIASYFGEKIGRELPPYLAEQTVRQMLSMQTCGSTPNWFYAADKDRTRLYFNAQSADHPAGTLFAYDSPGSQVLCALVEKTAGGPLFDYLNDRIFKYLGTFENAEILKTPNGDSWGDSALICSTYDMASFARFLMRGGEVNGKQLLNRKYIETATSKITATDCENSPAEGFGYGYQIWKHEKGGFGFFGMGCQYTVCMPDKDLLFCCTADNQGNPAATDLIFGALFDFIYDTAVKSPLPANEKAEAALADYAKGLSLYCIKGEENTSVAEKINGKTFYLRENKMGVKSFQLHLNGKSSYLHYVNAQGEKNLKFGINENVFDFFPQIGYSNGVGGVSGEAQFCYRCAASAAFTCENVLRIDVQIIDRYFGNLTILFGFAGKEVYLKMKKNAEAFLEEYNGSAVGFMEENKE